MSVSDILYIKTQMVTGFEALSKKAYPVIIYDSRFSHFYRMVSFYVAFNVVRFQMSWLFLACCFQRGMLFYVARCYFQRGYVADNMHNAQKQRGQYST